MNDHGINKKDFQCNFKKKVSLFSDYVNIMHWSTRTREHFLLWTFPHMVKCTWVRVFESLVNQKKREKKEKDECYLCPKFSVKRISRNNMKTVKIILQSLGCWEESFSVRTYSLLGQASPTSGLPIFQCFISFSRCGIMGGRFPMEQPQPSDNWNLTI